MQDIIQKIIEIDKRAQKMTDEAQELRKEAEASIESDKKALREQYLERARRRIAITNETEDKYLAGMLADIDKKYADISKELDAKYEGNHSKWAGELYDKVIGG
jgi:hypothetical protein